MLNRMLDWIAAAIVVAIVSAACASPAPIETEWADCPYYDCGE